MWTATAQSKTLRVLTKSTSPPRTFTPRSQATVFGAIVLASPERLVKRGALLLDTVVLLTVHLQGPVAT
eukprot:scaffold158_cov388-Prasinococcus_capsulatus_cf.AAC.9